MTSTTSGPGAEPVLRTTSLAKHYTLRGRGRRRTVRAVDDLDLALVPGTVTAVVGESGSGKSTVAKMLVRLVRPSSGRITLDGRDAGRMNLRAYRKDVQMVFQDPFASLNSVHTIGYHLARPLLNFGRARRGADVAGKVRDLLQRVKLDPQFADKLPHELSGGQRQRAAIARALASEPRVLLADEPISMLDVSIRLGILNLLGELRDTDGLAILYVTHDIASARYFADRTVVMYAGKVVESGTALEVTDQPAHPYTQLLISAAPDPQRIEIVDVSRASSGAASAPTDGCRFRDRCPFAMDVCRQQPPDVAVTPSHTAACWLRVDESQRPASGREAA
ncbi:ABC transporter ATP-binding protein [Nakamurella endophytica]|uniref:Dipeptide/oligopeptide/nickel ABC transporter ATP-binding protein n=1 Tax=Nakamurella endophytica TaxID=1748367 RepID=A0A917ST88_9ACTN|nr:ABC transporter ATP-binding protein [Nakamurella endophytica]GGL94464.1 dipeptide/oligopeptide/nickel ABC transporter ATP-binding protein [Nakamurella endophytica]